MTPARVGWSALLAFRSSSSCSVRIVLYPDRSPPTHDSPGRRSGLVTRRRGLRRRGGPHDWHGPPECCRLVRSFVFSVRSSSSSSSQRQRSPVSALDDTRASRVERPVGFSFVVVGLCPDRALSGSFAADARFARSAVRSCDTPAGASAPGRASRLARPARVLSSRSVFCLFGSFFFFFFQPTLQMSRAPLATG